MSKKSGNGPNIYNVSFWLLVAAAILYVLGIIFNFFPALKDIVMYLQAVATAAMICIVAVLAWRYVSGRAAVWKVLYFVVLLIALAGIVIPAVFRT